jgi:2-pyrone-4,6-dicarboxylate lactonase
MENRMSAANDGADWKQPCQSPDLDPRRPTIDVPSGACDCHVHIFGPEEEYPMKPVRRYTPSATGIDDYRRMLSVTGVERAVIVQTGIYEDGQVTVDAVAASGGRWRGIALLDASATEREVERLHSVGFCGVRFNPRNLKEAGLRGLEEVAAVIRPFGWHVQFHLDARDLVEIGPRLERLPTDIVIDHFGHVPTDAGVDHPGFQYLLRMLKDHRCWVKLSAPNRFRDPRPPYPAVLPYAKALVAVEPARLVWGSDWPHSRFSGFMPNDGELLDLLALWAPDPAVRRRILVDNPAKLYGF